MGSPGRSEHAAVLTRAQVVVRGRVQGVFFRASTAEQATARGLTGWVRNKPDGSVEAAFQGQRDRVEEMLEWVAEGPPAARVESVEVDWKSPIDGEDSFAAPW